MPKNEINQTGVGNFAFTDINDSEFNIFVGKSYQYNELLEQLNTQEKLFSRTPEDEKEERLAISQKINALKQLIEQFKRDVLQLAEQFNRTEINTDRLRRAKEFFDKGEFGEARAVLETELEQMQDEQTRLLVKRDEYETDTLPKLKSNAEQFFFLALLTQLNKADGTGLPILANTMSVQSKATRPKIMSFITRSFHGNTIELRKRKSIIKNI